MTYLEFDNAYGRLSNHFYWLLLAHKYSKMLNTPVKILKNKSFYDFNLDSSYKLFNLNQFAEDRSNVTLSDTIYKNDLHHIRRYHQIFRLDFTIEEIESFIKDTFLKSVPYSNTYLYIHDVDNVAIHIRNGDYIDDAGMDIFDRATYIQKALATQHNILQLTVYSDDNDMNYKLYHLLFLQYTKNITYVRDTTGIEDFISFSFHKHKILWNSTFSYWAAFIGNTIYKDSYSCVTAPSLFGRDDPKGDHINPLWNVVNLELKRKNI